MSEKQTSKPCPRCQTENRMEHNFCWLCGIGLNQQHLPSGEYRELPVQRNRSSVGASVGVGVFGALAGAMGGVVIGIMIVVVFIMATFNAILESCAAKLLFLSATASATIWSIISWLF